MIKKKIKKVVGMPCLKCKGFIDPKTHYVLVGTYNIKNRCDEEVYFHIDCWKQYFDDCVLRKVKKNVAVMQDKAMGLFNSPMIKDVLKNIDGSAMALNMLKMPLNTNSFISKKEVEDQLLKNDRKKRRKRSQKMQKV